jgi:hypothetical protein
MQGSVIAQPVPTPGTKPDDLLSPCKVSGDYAAKLVYRAQTANEYLALHAAQHSIAISFWQGSLLFPRSPAVRSSRYLMRLNPEQPHPFQAALDYLPKTASLSSLLLHHFLRQPPVELLSI